MTINEEKKYIITVPQMANIVRYCLRMTVRGDDARKDWEVNVREAIGESGSKTVVSMDKIHLENYQPKTTSTDIEELRKDYFDKFMTNSIAHRQDLQDIFDFFAPHLSNKSELKKEATTFDDFIAEVEDFIESYSFVLKEYKRGFYGNADAKLGFVAGLKEVYDQYLSSNEKEVSK